MCLGKVQLSFTHIPPQRVMLCGHFQNKIPEITTQNTDNIKNVKMHGCQLVDLHLITPSVVEKAAWSHSGINLLCF